MQLLAAKAEDWLKGKYKHEIEISMNATHSIAFSALAYLIGVLVRLCFIHNNIWQMD